jgi:hypothetical protein
VHVLPKDTSSSVCLKGISMGPLMFSLSNCHIFFFLLLLAYLKCWGSHYFMFGFNQFAQELDRKQT